MIDWAQVLFDYIVYGFIICSISIIACCFVDIKLIVTIVVSFYSVSLFVILDIIAFRDLVKPKEYMK